MSEDDKKGMLTFGEYHAQAMSTAIYPQRGQDPYYPVLGICGEAGEVAEKFKKIIRDQGGVWTPEDQRAIKAELGDVLWYVAAVADEFGMSLEDVARGNLEKRERRAARGKLGGEGDDR